MKKFLALILALVLAVTVIPGCSSNKKKDDEIKGAVIKTYLSSVPVSIDPSSFYGSADSVKYMGLLFEGLTTIDEKGNLKKALAKEWEYDTDERDGYLKLEITLKNSRWSDGIIVDADDFIYAWSRILLPENSNQNASLLYPILNAKKVKEGLVSVNDLGVCATKDNVIEITFEKDFTDVDYFLRRLASPALAPLREDIVTRNTEWAVQGNTSYVTNGPFKIKTWSDSEFTLERSTYFRCVSDSESNKDSKEVTPYQIVNLYSEGKTPDDQYELFANDGVFYINLDGATAETLKSAGKSAKSSDLLSTYCMFFNTNDELFSDARVRKALSLALDRTAIAKGTSLGVTPATGLIPTGIEDVSKGKDFRKAGGELISAKSNMDEAKKLLKEAGVSKGDITIEVSSARKYEKDIISDAVEAWEDLGFKVNVSSPKQNYLYNKANGIYEFGQNGANVLCYDFQSMTTDAYAMLMAFSGEYGGGKVDVTTGASEDDVVFGTNFTGYSDEKYDELCGKILSAANAKDRTAAMHEAEKYLVDASPVVPLFYNKNVYVSQKLSKISSDGYGRYIFNKVKQSNYKKYLPVEEDTAAADTAKDAK